MEFPLESSGIPMEFPPESSGIPLESSGISTEYSRISTDPVEFPLESSGKSSGITLFQWKKVPFIPLEFQWNSTRIPVDSSGIPLIFSVGLYCNKILLNFGFMS